MRNICFLNYLCQCHVIDPKSPLLKWSLKFSYLCTNILDLLIKSLLLKSNVHVAQKVHLKECFVRKTKHKTEIPTSHNKTFKATMRSNMTKGHIYQWPEWPVSLKIFEWSCSLVIFCKSKYQCKYVCLYYCFFVLIIESIVFVSENY